MIGEKHRKQLFDLLQRDTTDCTKVWAGGGLLDIELSTEEVLLIKLTIPPSEYDMWLSGIPTTYHHE